MFNEFMDIPEKKILLLTDECCSEIVDKKRCFTRKKRNRLGLKSEQYHRLKNMIY